MPPDLPAVAGDRPGRRFGSGGVRGGDRPGRRSGSDGVCEGGRAGDARRAAGRRSIGGLAGEAGQASLELVALLPVLAVLALLGWQGLVAGQAVWLSGTAARAAARAQAVGGDPARAARATLPRILRRGLRVRRIADAGVEVRLAVPVVAPGLTGPIATVARSARFAAQGADR